MESTSAGDTTYTGTDRALSALEQARDHLAEVIKVELSGAAFQDRPVIPPVLTVQTSALRPAVVTALGACYKQLNSSVGEFGTATLQAPPRRSRAPAPATPPTPAPTARCPPWSRRATTSPR